MGLVLYRKGDTHTVKGVLCELKVVDSATFTGQVEKGWYISVNDIDGIPEPKEPEVVKDLEPVNIDELPSEKIRELARINKIEKFSTARISTLKGKLTACQEQATLKAS